MELASATFGVIEHLLPEKPPQQVGARPDQAWSLARAVRRRARGVGVAHSGCRAVW
ncbi:Uncharacterised protein [Amycolatopsis camponoti]|uniref:Uncharacterized protein n=1 Tax=Amycolatopsis camponoti TaxID=2606593 RepID=A0A6I8LZC0_9PSEU|nr:Uncharacterised protein [Amycolatopsis camponoti]